MGCYYLFHVTRLLLTKKFVNHRSRFDSRKHGHKNMTNSQQVSLTKRLIVATAIKSREICMKSCALESRQRLFRCSHRKKIG